MVGYRCCVDRRWVGQLDTLNFSVHKVVGWLVAEGLSFVDSERNPEPEVVAISTISSSERQVSLDASR